MPTRTEVIQALRARDEFQNRDIALILDYLEQEAASSSSTRDTILRSRRRIQDEVSRRDLIALYNYLAELGTPASTTSAFLNSLARRRDIVSRKMVNLLMDEIDASSFVPPPPAQGNLLHWFDFTDNTTLWQDTAGTMPAILTGQDIARVDNKGTDGTALLQAIATERMEVDTAFHSLPSALASDAGGNVGTINATIAAALASDYSFCVVAALDNTTLAEIPFSWSDGVPNVGMQVRYVSGGLWQMLGPAASTLASVAGAVINVYESAIKVSRTVNTQQAWFSLDSGSVSSSDTYTGVLAAQSLVIGSGFTNGGFDFQGHIGEILVWNSDQTSNVSAIQTYINNKYGVVWA